MIIIVGGGPIGCFLGGVLAKAGKDVSIFEEHGQIGKPVQCTGIVTEELGKIFRLEEEFIVNKLDKVRVYAKNKKIEIPTKDIVIDREKFDRYLARKAEKYGAKIFLEHKFLGIMRKDAIFADRSNKIIKVKAEAVIGADGALSEVGKANDMFKKRKFYFGMQARVKGRFDSGVYETYFGSICRDFFCWVVPESSNIARIGCASKGNPKEAFKRFLDVKGIDKKNIIDYQAGLIPIYDNKADIEKKGVYLVGDSAGHVKATTGGGLVPGMKAAKILAKCLIYNKNYEKELRKLKKELGMHLKIRDMLNKFDDEDYNNLLKLMRDKKIKRILGKYNRDNAKKAVFKAVIAKPSILLYIKNFIK
jgi:geranylgeranyl reductase family protein